MRPDLFRSLLSAPRRFLRDENGNAVIESVFMLPLVIWAGYLNVVNNYLPKGLYLLSGMSVVLVILMTIVAIAAFRRWAALLQINKTVKDSYGDEVLALVSD